MKSCKDCPNFKPEDDGWCLANLWEGHSIGCLLKMMIQELRLLNLDTEEGEEWKV